MQFCAPLTEVLLFLSSQEINPTELRVASAEKAAYYLDAALAARTRPVNNKAEGRKYLPQFSGNFTIDILRSPELHSTPSPGTSVFTFLPFLLTTICFFLRRKHRVGRKPEFSHVFHCAYLSVPCREKF